jgi:U3 small nucleolar RNA-associated protein 14
MKAPRKKNDILLSKDSTALTKTKNKLKKQAKKREEEKEKLQDDAVVEISMENVLLGTEASTSTLAAKRAKEKTTESRRGPMTNVDTADNDSDAALNNEGKTKTKGPKAFEQRDLVALAFAGDNVVLVRFQFSANGTLAYDSVAGV